MGSVSQDYLPLKSPMASGESPAYPQFLSCSATHQRFPRLPPRVQSFARAAHRVQESRVPAGLLLLSRSVVSSPSATPWTVAPRPRSMALPRQEHWAGCRSLLQGILLTRGLNPGLHTAGRLLPCGPPEKPWVTEGGGMRLGNSTAPNTPVFGPQTPRRLCPEMLTGTHLGGVTCWGQDFRPQDG